MPGLRGLEDRIGEGVAVVVRLRPGHLTVGGRGVEDPERVQRGLSAVVPGVSSVPSKWIDGWSTRELSSAAGSLDSTITGPVNAALVFGSRRSRDRGDPSPSQGQSGGGRPKPPERGRASHKGERVREHRPRWGWTSSGSPSPPPTHVIQHRGRVRSPGDPSADEETPICCSVWSL